MCVYVCVRVCWQLARQTQWVHRRNWKTDRCVCVCVCARNIWADGIKFPSARFTPHGPLMSQHCACACVDVCTCLIHIVGT